VYEQLVGNKHPWTLSRLEQRVIEAALLKAPSGGRWLFENPARCAT
jgi:hypothetical protein